MLDRITFDPNIMGERACIRSMRITVSQVVNLVANGMTMSEIIRDYHYLEEEDIRQGHFAMPHNLQKKKSILFLPDNEIPTLHNS